MSMTTGVISSEEIFYPETDGKPMAETDTHRNLMIDLIEALKDYLRNEPLVYVSGNLLIYFQKGDPSACVAPDVFVVKGVPKRERRIYRIWEEKETPDFVLELTSRSTAFEDLQSKKQIYEQQLKVKEYFLFDPLGAYLTPALLGYRLVQGQYSKIPIVTGKIESEVLGLELGVQKGQIRLFEPDTGELLLNPIEQAEARREAEKRVQHAEKRVQYEVVARQRAEKIAQQAEEKAQNEAEVRRKAEEKLARLKAELEALRS